MRKSRALALTGGALASLALLAGCQSAGSERPVDEATSVPPPSEAPTQQAPQGAPADFLVDSTPGGPEDQDPLWQTLKSAAADKKEVYLKVAMHNYSEPAASGDQVTVINDTPDSVSVTVDKGRVEKLEPTFYVITGTFTAEEVGSSAYKLTTVDDKEITELNLPGEDDEARCTADDGTAAIDEAVEQLRSNPDSRDNMRRIWGAAPAVWWGIQASAKSLEETQGNVAGDSLVEACDPYLN